MLRFATTIDTRHGATYGAEKMKFTIMKFPVVLAVLVGAAVCGVEAVSAKVMSDLKYLEHLNDLDVRNVEPEMDIHQQWPFVSIARPMEDGDMEAETEEEDGAGQKYIDPESLLQAAVLTRLELGNPHSQNFREMLFDRMDEGLRQMKDTSERGDHLSQYRRYKPFDQEMLEEARMYPDKNEEDVRFNNDDTAYTDESTYFADDDEVVREPHPLPFPRPFFPRIAPVETPSFGDTFRDTLDEEDQQREEPEMSQKEVVIENHKPMYHQMLFPRIAPIYIHENYKIDDIGFNNNKHDQHDHDEYKFKEGELFPENVRFDEVPVVEDPSEFGVKPDDPRFYRDADKIEEKTSTPKLEEPVHPYILNSAYVSKSKMNSRSDSTKESESLPDQVNLNSNKEVQVVPFKPDKEEDGAGVYILAIVAGISAALCVGMIAVLIGWYNYHKNMKNAEDTDYPSYGIVGPNKDYEKKNRDEAGDRKLAQSAQMYHYQHQKQQIIAMGRNTQGHGSQSDTDEEEDEEGNYTVYECPGLASIEGPLEVKNPMFDDNQLLVTPSQTPSKPEDQH